MTTRRARSSSSRGSATLRIVEPRARLGGRVWTVRDPALGPYHAVQSKGWKGALGVSIVPAAIAVLLVWLRFG